MSFSSIASSVFLRPSYNHNTVSSIQTTQDRINWIDYAKGLLIILVVFGHVLRGLHGAHIPIDNEKLMDTLIYSFHMPAFFWLSGLFLGKNMGHGFKDFYQKKLSRVLYPFLLWSLIQGSLSVILNSMTNSSKDMHRLAFFWLYPLDQFWFLHALVLIQVLFFLTKRFSWKTLLGIGFVFWGIGAYAGLDYPLANPLLNYIYVVAGWLCTQYNEFELCTKYRSYLNPLSYCPILVIAFCAYLSIQFGITIPLLTALAGIFTILQISMLMSHFQILPFIKRLGEHSLSIFILHTLIISATRMALQKVFHIDNGLSHEIIGTTAGLLLPFLIFSVLEKRKLTQPLFLR